MSDYILRLIPEQPDFLPLVTTQRIQQEIQKLKISTDDVIVKIHDHVAFIDAGENFGYILCPVCREKLTIEWWQQSMNDAWKTKFSVLASLVPCCGVEVSLNDLVYEWRIGFAKFCIEIYNPTCELKESEYASLEQLVGIKLNVIRCHL